MGARLSRSDFQWVYSDEPHTTRRREMLQKYPAIKKLMGYDWRIAVQVFITVLIQLIMAILVRDLPWKFVWLLTYIISGTLNHSLSISFHEIGHNLAFGNHRPIANRILGYIANLPLCIPSSVTFKKYHIDHHKFQGDDTLDPDLPTYFEAWLFQSRLGKVFYIIAQPLLYAVRPLLRVPKPVTLLEVINLFIELAFDGIIMYFLGRKSLVYLLFGTLLGLGLHPISGHFISEHYIFVEGYETYSYYGPLNYLTYNVGYHNEHHDFPNIPGYALPQLKKIAPDYYDNRPCHYSWIRVLYDFIRNPELGPKSRIRRTIHSDALKTKNVINLKNKSKVNDILHGAVDNNNNNQPTHISKEERKLMNIKKHSTVTTNGYHSKNE
jgi:sphingolipid delta-4 desaturase